MQIFMETLLKNLNQGSLGLIESCKVTTMNENWYLKILRQSELKRKLIGYWKHGLGFIVTCSKAQMLSKLTFGSHCEFNEGMAFNRQP